MIVFRRELGELLRERRLAQGRTLREVSRAASCSLGYLSEVERGTKEASSEVLWSLCAALDLQLSDILADLSGRVGRLERISAPVPLPIGKPEVGLADTPAA